MKLCSSKQTITRKNSENCVVTEYPIDDKTIDFVVVTISGRYPDERHAINLISKEIVYISAGHGKVVVTGKEYQISAGDVVLIEANEKYYWQGNMTLHISCRPAWTKEQHQLID